MEKNNAKIVKTPLLTIYNNILKYKNTVIKLSNISKCEISSKPKRTYPIWSFIGLVLGFLILANRHIIFGIVLIGVCTIVISAIAYINSDPTVYLILELNSGSIVSFSSKDSDFLWEAQETLIECFNYNEEKCTINFSKCTITHSQIGEDNFMTNSEVQNGD